MATIDLINAANTAIATKATTASALTTAQQNDDHAGLDVTSTAQALHDDLAANGPYALVTIDTTQTPPVVTGVTEYTPVDPGSFLATAIRTT